MSVSKQTIKNRQASLARLAEEPIHQDRPPNSGWANTPWRGLQSQSVKACEEGRRRRHTRYLKATHRHFKKHQA